MAYLSNSETVPAKSEIVPVKPNGDTQSAVQGAFSSSANESKKGTLAAVGELTSGNPW
jgi:hypothetical protein